MIKFLFSIVVLTVFALAFGAQAYGQAPNEGKADLKAEFNAAKKVAPKRPWTGNWKYNSRYSPVTVEISAVKAQSLMFKIDAMAGANMGAVEGIAAVKGNIAFFEDSDDQTRTAYDPTGCKLLFINNGTSMELKQSEECSEYGGAGVYFEREKLLPGNPPYLEQDFSDREIFPTPAADKQFKTLVGAADYENFLNSFHLINEGEAVDTDTGATYFIGCVRGVCPYNTGIIMLDGKGKYWAAVNVDVNAETSSVHYYTNDPKWAGKLPAAIAEWAKDFSTKVIYKSKK